MRIKQWVGTPRRGVRGGLGETALPDVCPCRVRAFTLRAESRLRKGRSYGKGGFSLLELLAVMAIMAMLSTLAVTSYFSAIRGMGSQTARRNFTNALSMARQRACVDGCRVSLVVFNEVAEFAPDGKAKDLAASYVVCRELGRLSFVSGDKLVDEFTDLDKLFAGDSSGGSAGSSVAGAVKIYNLSRGSWTLVEPKAVKEKRGGRLLYSDPEDTFEIEAYALRRLPGLESNGGGSWQVGDSYGIEVMPVQSLPKGFFFQELNHTPGNDAALTDVKYVTFEPDGTRLGNQTPSFTVVSNDPNTKRITFEVEKKGLITVSD
ncbi:MAG TPA: type II secretion system protein [Kiritimatiellia bacterium]|nr:type II secretion system protein [Kiritimatiellia bacterium]